MFWKTYIKPGTTPEDTVVRAVQINSLSDWTKVTSVIKPGLLQSTEKGFYILEDPEHTYSGHGPVPYKTMSNEEFQRTYVWFDGKYLLSGGPCNV